MANNIKRARTPHSSSRFIANVDLFSDALTTKTLEGVLTSWNKGAEKVYGYKAKEVIGKSVNIIIPADKQDDANYLLKRVRNGEEVEDYETIQRRKDGSLINVSIDMVPIKISNGKIVGAAMVTRDITKQLKEREEFRAAMLNVLEDLNDEKRELEEVMDKLETLDRMRDTILNTGHELKSPLGPIKIQSQMLLAGDLGDVNSKQKSSLHMILSNIDRLNRVVNDLTDAARIESGAILIDYEKISLVALIKEAVLLLNAKAKNGGITLIVKLMDPPIISADRQKISEVIINLLENAIKFTPANGKITVTAKKDGNYAIVQVADTGIGISKESKKRLFTRFFQADSSIRRRFGGTGLGLSICKGIIEAHKGKIWAESKGIGKGSTFSFTLPIAEA